MVNTRDSQNQMNAALLGVIAGCYEDFRPGPVISRPPEVTRASESLCAGSLSRTDVWRVVAAVLRDTDG